MKNYDDLLRRLRMPITEMQGSPLESVARLINNICKEAADAIADLQAERPEERPTELRPLLNPKPGRCPVCGFESSGMNKERSK